MNDFIEKMMDQIKNPDFLSRALDAFIIFLAGFLIVRIIIFIVMKSVKHSLTPQSTMLLRRSISYTGLAIVILLVLGRLGVNLVPLMGAAGILGIAIGFASQTSFSNIISGLFIITEKPFEIGDMIRVNQTTGIVKSVDLLSIKILCFDNRYVRIPNELIINTEVTNVTRYPIRRVDIDLRVAYKEDLERVKELLAEVVQEVPQCLDNPEHLFLIKRFGESAVEILLGVWINKDQYLIAVNGLMMKIKQRFEEANIEIPFPQIDVNQGQRPMVSINSSSID
ncbi:MAG: mechanosensitive ion channel family protein [Spirochaetaceae bacterium]|nr:mechanosensitive ion channel family protein [Spirochaetaceae bacterium]